MAKKGKYCYLLVNTMLVCILLMGLTPIQPSAAAAEDSLQVKSFLDTFFSREEVKREAGAIAVSVVKNGQVLAEKGYGVTNQSSNRQVDSMQTTFRIASLSKVFTAVGLMQLVEQGKISIHDNIEEYLGEYKLVNPFDIPVTIEMLLTHTTGFEPREPTEANMLLDSSAESITLEEAIFANFPPVVRKPGTSYMYDNFASDLQGYIVQTVSGERFNDYMQKHVFEPIGMTSSSYLQLDDLLARLPTVYDRSGAEAPVYRLSPSEIPAGSMISTAHDISQFMISFLNGGTAPNGKSIISAASVRAMSTFHVSINADVPDATYGFEAPPLISANGYNVISKTGTVDGFNSLLWLLPDLQTGVFVTYNSNSNLSLKFISEFMDQFYSGEPKLGEKGYSAQSRTTLAKFDGVYADLRTGRLFGIHANEDGTLNVGNSWGSHQTLKQVGEWLFVSEEGIPMAFKTDEKGNVEYMKYSNSGSYAVKAPAAKGFPDVPANHPYAQYIYNLQSMGVIKDNPSRPFGSQDAVTRGQFIHEILYEFHIPASNALAMFSDISHSPYGPDIQAAAEIGLVSGTGQGRFEPDRPIKREEAAYIVLRLLVLSGYKATESSTLLMPGTSKWAEAAVKTIVDLKIHGPEVVNMDGKVEFNSQRFLTKQEVAAIMYLLILPDVSFIL